MRKLVFLLKIPLNYFLLWLDKEVNKACKQGIENTDKIIAIANKRQDNFIKNQIKQEKKLIEEKLNNSLNIEQKTKKRL